MDINVVNRHLHLGEKLLRINYNTPSVLLTGTLQGCDGCAQSKSKQRAARKILIQERQSQDKVFLWTGLVHFRRF